MHPVGYFTVRLFEALNRQEFSTFVYSDRPGRDPLSARIEQNVFAWNDVIGMSDEALSQRVRDDQIDILFDMAGHTASNRLMVFARRSAPIQITWAGYVGTTGLAEMDYLLADRYHVPTGSETLYREDVLRLPHGYVTYEPPPDAPPVTPLPALENGFFTFAAMCNPAKVNPAVLELWSQILQRNTNARLLLCYSGWNDIGNQRRVLAGLGDRIDAARVDFKHCNGPSEVLALYGQVDLALDTFPYSGGLTTCEATWMGVPTITLPGDKFAGRHSFSHLSNVGLVECIAHDQADYVARAVELASDLQRLQVLRLTLRQRMTMSPLCDGAAFAFHFGQIMRGVWHRWCAGK
jgi:predicted O-linked N-acetylglucosamine transferase (SPINDLY family)